MALPLDEDAIALGLKVNPAGPAFNYYDVTYNAFYANPSAVRAHSGDRFAVKDTGIGISAADLPYIFERFWRADRVRSRISERGGFGLGLAISQWIAQAHGGTLTASSRLTRGSVFTVTLPFVPEGATAEYEIPRLPAAQPAG